MARKRTAQTTLLVALGLAVGLAVALAVDNRTLKHRLEQVSERALEPYPGMPVPALRTVTLQGDSVTIAARKTGERQVLFFFTTTCPHSRASIPVWNCVATRMRREANVRVYGIGLDSVRLLNRLAEQQTVSFPVVALRDRGYARLFRVRRVPLVMVVNDSGHVSYAKFGGAAANGPGVETSEYPDTNFHDVFMGCAAAFSTMSRAKLRVELVGLVRVR